MASWTFAALLVQLVQAPGKSLNSLKTNHRPRASFFVIIQTTSESLSPTSRLSAYGRHSDEEAHLVDKFSTLTYTRSVDLRNEGIGLNDVY